MQNQPVVCVHHEFRRNALEQTLFHSQRRLARGQARAIADSENMCVNCHRGLSESDVQHDICRLAPYPGQGLQRLARAGHSATKLLGQDFAGGDQVPGLAVIKPNRADVLAQTLFAQGEDFLRSVCYREQPFGGFVDADIGRLCRQQHGSQQFKNAGVLKLCLRRWIDGLQGLKEN